MIWNDTRLRAACIDGMVTPYDAQCVNPASIDLRLDMSYRLPGADGWSREILMPESGVYIQPGQFILCCTLETVAIPVNACAELFSKSSTGRIGLEHLHAGWIDPGFVGQLTLEFKNVAPWPVLLVPGKRYMQMVVHSLTAPAARDYSVTGRYQNQQGATPAREVR